MIARKGAELIELFGETETWREMRHHRILRIFNIHDRLPRPGVSIEITANHVAVLGPGVKAVRGAVRAAETLTLTNELQEIGLLLIGQWQFAAGEEIHRIEGPQEIGPE